MKPDKFHLPEDESLTGLEVLYDTDELEIFLDGNLPVGEYISANDVIGECGTRSIHYHFNEGSKYLYLNIDKDGSLSITEVLYIINRVIISEDLDIYTITKLNIGWI